MAKSEFKIGILTRGGVLFPMLLAAMVSALWAVKELPEPLADSIIETGLRRQVIQWKRRVISRLSEGDTTFVSSQLTPEDRVSLINSTGYKVTDKKEN